MTDPTRTDRREQALSFGSVAAAYDRGRPSYPREAVEWLVGTRPASVLELGAGTGKLTTTLVELGHDVFATDPDEAMLDILSARLPDVRATVGSAEQLPVPDASYDVVVAGQAYHWFDLDRALPEIARVLKPGGRLALVWNLRDERIPWVKRLGRLLGQQDSERDDLPAGIDDTGWFSAIDEKVFRHWQIVDRESVQDLVLSRSNVAVLDPVEREEKVREVLAFYDDYGRGMDGMQLPLTAVCYRTTLLPSALLPSHPQPVAEPTADPVEPVVQLVADEGDDGSAASRSLTDTAERLPRVVGDDGPDTEMILIDFR